MPRDLPLLTTASCFLRIAAASDVPAVLDYWTRNRDHLRQSRPIFEDNFFSDAYWRSRVEQSLAEFERDLSLRLFLFDRARPDRVIGTVNFTEVLRSGAQFCYLGYGIDAVEAGKGRMREALSEALEYAFVELDLHRVMANYMPRNERSGRLLRSLGFVVEGYARDYLRIDGKWEDHLLTSLTNQGWQGR